MEPVADRDQLLTYVEQSYKTRGLGIYNRETGERISTVGNVGEALKEAAEKIARNAEKSA